MTDQGTEDQALVHNSPDKWAQIWAHEGESSWRPRAMRPVYDRILQWMRMNPPTRVLDVGGGIGLFADQIKEAGVEVAVLEHSADVVQMGRQRGHTVIQYNLGMQAFDCTHGGLVADTYVATEVIEHLSEYVRDQLLRDLAEQGRRLLVSVPNDRLGPDEEPQHTIKWTPLEFLQYLRKFFGDARVEVIGNYLLGFCGYGYKPYQLSVTMPVRNEAADLGRTLASFRGVADEIVIGVDPRTDDNTREVARKYAEVVFDLEAPQGPPGEERSQKGVHFAWIRNQCIDRCSGDWIMMSEGHEHLDQGQDVLLALHTLPPYVKVGLVLRRLGTQQWGFPWLFKKDPTIRFIRHTHNSLDYPDGTGVVKLRGVVTVHDRVHERDAARAAQRKTQNRASLLEDWLKRESTNSLYYLGAEWRGFDPQKSREYFEEFLRVSRNGPQRYQARMELAHSYARYGEISRLKDHLYACTGEDWSRVEHFIWLGDLAFEAQQYEEAHRFYRWASVAIGNAPFTLWWIDLAMYSYVPAQRLAMVCCELERYDEALRWARRVVELLPEDAPDDLKAECQANIVKLEEVA
jgi:hypothetical protein